MAEHDDLSERLSQLLESTDLARDLSGNPDLAPIYAAKERLENLFNLLRQPVSPGSGTSAADLQPGDKLGEFLLVKSLAAGGMGTVFLARQESLDRIVAIKVCQPHIARDKRLLERFENEAHILANIRHPHVVPILTTGVDHGHPYLAMEYIPGPTLATLLRHLRAASANSRAIDVKNRILDGSTEPSAVKLDGLVELDKEYAEWIVTVAAKIALALAEIHSRGLIHLDVKPANIVLDAQGEPILVDFGLAMADPMHRQPNLGPGFVGTLAYASPEQLGGNLTKCSAATDVFGLGVLLYECLTLCLPFSRNECGIGHGEKTTRAPRLRDANPRISWELEAITAKCLEFNASKRYRNGAHLFRDLGNLIDAKPVEARSTLVRRARYWASRHPLGAGISAFVMAIALFTACMIPFEPFRRRAREDFHANVNLADSHFLLAHAFSLKRQSADAEDHKDAAINDYTKALTLAESRWLRTQRAILYLESSDTVTKALEELRVLAAEQPSIASLQYLLGIAFERSGDVESAAAARRTARHIYPRTAEDLYWLGHIALYVEGNPKAARIHWSNCLLLKPDSYGGRMVVENGRSAGANLHFMARIERALHTGLPPEASAAEIELAAELSPNLAEICDLNRLAKSTGSSQSSPTNSD